MSIGAERWFKREQKFDISEPNCKIKNLENPITTFETLKYMEKHKRQHMYKHDYKHKCKYV